MSKLIKIIALLVFLFGVLSVANAFYPGTFEKIKSVITKKPVTEEKTNEEYVNEVLGKTTQNQVKDLEEKVLDEVSKLPSAVASQPLVQDITQRVNQEVEKRIVEIQEIPGQVTEKAKEEVRKQIYQEICKGWLKGD